MSYEKLKGHLDRAFPKIWEQIDPKSVTTALLIQIKGSDVHPSVRHPDFSYQSDHPRVLAGKKKVGQPINKKTQVDITAPIHVPGGISPVTALFTPGAAVHNPVTIFHPLRKEWVKLRIKIQPQKASVNGPAPDQARLLLGGRDPNSWSSELWGNMGHYSKDERGFILFIRRGSEAPFSFSLPRHQTLEELLMEHGVSKGRRGPSVRFKHLVGSPISKSAAIGGPGDVPSGLVLEHMYVVTTPNEIGWVKIGRTEKKPKQRLRGYLQGPVVYDMNFICGTSDCVAAEDEVKVRLDMLGVEKRGREWYKLGSTEPAVRVIKEVVKLYPPPVDIKIDPIIISEKSWSYQQEDE